MGQFTHKEPFSSVNFPFAHGMHDADPLKLVVPASQSAHAFLDGVLLVPDLHGLELVQWLPSKLQASLTQPSATSC